MKKEIIDQDIVILQVGQVELKANQPIISYDWVIDPQTPKNAHGLCIGNYTFAKNVDLLKKNGISAVVSVFGQTEIKFDESISHFRILIGDNPSENIKCFFDSAIKFISEHIKTTNVLVHCKAGVSRSATVVAAYMMQTQQMTCADAVTFLKGKRKLVDPNKGFMKQLRQFDRQLRQKRQKQNCICF